MINCGKLLVYLESAEEAIKEDEVTNVEDFISWLGIDKENCDNEELEYVVSAWAEGWKRHTDSRKDAVRLMAKRLRSFYYQTYVREKKWLTKEEFDRILKEEGFIRIPFPGDDPIDSEEV